MCTSLGDQVIRVPNFSVPTMRAFYSGAEQLPALMPQAPEGCKEHPAPAQALRLSSLLAPDPDHVAVPLRAISLFQSGERSTIQDDNERVFDEIRARQMHVRYRFNQQQLSLERMFQLDVSIREWLNSIVVENYPWP